MSRILLAGIELPADLQWTDEFTGWRVGQAVKTSLTGARIVQESLTNVVRHSTASTAAVTVHYTGSRLSLAIDDDGSPRDGASTGGSGITGMRERARALGGAFTATRVAGGGFSVRASLPLDESAFEA